MRFAITALLAAPAAAAAGLSGSTCNSSSPYQQWVAFADKTLRSGSLCATAARWPLPAGDGTAVALAPCVSPPPPAQQFNLTGAVGANAISVVAAAAPGWCLNLAGYGTAPGTQAWLFACTPADCKGTCAWAAGPGAAHLVNPTSGLCLDAGGEPPAPPAPHTCAPGSPSAGLPFCDFSQPIAARVADLYGRLTFDQRIELFSIPIHPNTFDAGEFFARPPALRAPGP